ERRGATKGIRPHGEGHAPERRLIAIDAAPRSGDADGAAAIGAFAKRQESRRYGASAAAGRAARVLRQVKGVLGRAVHVVVAGAAETEHRAVGLADHDCAGLLHALDEHAAGVDDIVLESANAPKGGDPTPLEV